MNVGVEPKKWYAALEEPDKRNVYDLLKFFDVALPAYRFPIVSNFPTNARTLVSVVGDSVEKALGERKSYDDISVVVARELLMGGHLRHITLQIMRGLGWGQKIYDRAIYAEPNGHGYRETDDTIKIPNPASERTAAEVEVMAERVRFMSEQIAGRAVTDEEQTRCAAEFLGTTTEDLEIVEAIDNGMEQWEDKSRIHGWRTTLLPCGGSAIDMKAFAGYLTYSRSAEEWLKALETLERPFVILRDYGEKPGVGLLRLD